MANSANVVPLASPQNLQKRRSSIVSKVKNKASDLWVRSQIGHRTEYSVERLLSFRDYYQRTSFTRAITVCILTPIPALVVALAIDCIPLEPPSEGWRANYAAWIRLFVTMFTISLGLVAQVKEVITRGTITNMGAVKVALGTATTYVAVSITLAAVWRFPIPFGLVLMVSPYVWIFSFYTVMVIGPRVLTGSPVLRQQIMYQLLIVSTQGVVAVAYPLFSGVFNMLTGPQQTAFVLVMPLIKFFTKQIIARAAQSLHEYVGPIVVFSVDVYNVFYVAICMQAATSTWTTLVIIASDSFHVVVALRSIFQQTNAVQQSTPHFLQDMPAIIQSVLVDAEPTHARSRRIRVSAPFPLPLSPKSGAILNKLKKAKQGPATSEQNAVESATMLSGGSSAISLKQAASPIQLIPSNLSKSFFPTITLASNRQITPIDREQTAQPKGIHLAKPAWQSIQKLSFVEISSKGDSMTLVKKVADHASERLSKKRCRLFSTPNTF